jgi:hypothetical protein
MARAARSTPLRQRLHFCINLPNAMTTDPMYPAPRPIHLLRRGARPLSRLALLLGIALCLPLTACNVGVSGDDGTSWTGNWSVGEIDGQTPDADAYYVIEEGTFTVVGFAGSCTTASGEIVSTDGDEFLVAFRTSRGDTRLQADVDGASGSQVNDQLTLTVESGSVPGVGGVPPAEAGATVSATSFGETDPREAFCN